MTEKQYIVRLTNGERSLCEHGVKRLFGSIHKARRARRLLLADADGPEA